MEPRFLKQTLLFEFMEALRPFGELHGPTVSEQGVAGFAALPDLSALQLDYQRTQIPPKKYLIPFKEDILNYQDGSYMQVPSDLPDIVLFGLHPCDLEGISYLDQVFLTERPDPNYRARRERLTLVGISCQPDDFCFCTGSWDTAPCDLFLRVQGDGYQLTASSAKGAQIAKVARHLFSEAGPAPLPTLPHHSIDPQDPQLRFSDDPRWTVFANSCVSCGACSVCCPTCYCFDVREYPDLTGGSKRLREWDNCLFVTHGEVAGGNFRASRLDRLRYRFLHKYCGFSPLQGVCSCVGCGRCKEVCPVDIDLRELTEDCRSKAPGLP